ncbi:MAG: hypothetical protein ACKOI2_13205 [Actinomycetota bacterium]
MEQRRTSRLDEPELAEVLSALHFRAEVNDQTVIPRVLSAAAERGAQSDQEMSDLLADAYIPISLLFLDGWKGLYLPLLRQLEGRLVNGAIVVADDTTLLPELCADYLDYIRSNAGSYVSSSLPVDDGLEVSVVIR